MTNGTSSIKRGWTVLILLKANQEEEEEEEEIIREICPGELVVEQSAEHGRTSYNGQISLFIRLGPPDHVTSKVPHEQVVLNVNA